METTGADPLVIDTTARLLDELCGPEVVGAAEDGAWPGALWEALEGSALTRAWIPEAFGGPGTSLADGFAIARAAGAYAVPAPLAETLLAGWLASEAGLEPPEGPLTVAPVDTASSVELEGDALYGSAARVPFARACGHLVVVFGNGGAGGTARGVAIVERAACALEPGTSLAGEPSDTVLFDGVIPISRSAPGTGDHAERLRRMGAVLRAGQMAGALERCLEQSLRYAADRHQFGRPIAKFQAVQHNLAVLAGEVAAATTSADAAVSAIARHGIEDERSSRSPPRRSGAARRQAPAPPSPTRCTARWASPASTASSTAPGGSGRGVTSSTPRRCGRSRSAGTSRSVALMTCGRRSPRPDAPNRCAAIPVKGWTRAISIG